MSKRENLITVNLIKPILRSLGSGHKGKASGTVHKKTLKRQRAINNLPFYQDKLKKVKLNKENAERIKDNQSEAGSEESDRSIKVRMSLKKEVNVISWEQKRILAVHAYYFFRSVGQEDCINFAASFAQVSASFIRKVKDKFKSQGEISPYTMWGHHSKYITIFDYEDKVLQAKKWIRINSSSKGQKELTSEGFANYCNTVLMIDLVDNIDCKFNGITPETARRWLHGLGFQYSSKTGGYNDGHEKREVKAYRKEYLRMILDYEKRTYLFDEKGIHVDTWDDLTFRNKYPLGGYLKRNVQKPVILLFHDESIFNVNDSKKRFWQDAQTSTITPKGKGQGIMVSDFVTENGFLDDDSTEGLRVCLEYNKEGHWTHEKLKEQVLHAIKVFDRKYPGHQGIFIFDNSTVHVAKEENALNAKKNECQ